MTRPTGAAFFLFLSTLSPSFAQTESSRGPLVEAPMAMLVSSGGAASEPYECSCRPTCTVTRSALDERTLYVRRPGIVSLEPVGTPLPSTPPFDLATLFPSLGGTIPAGFELGSMSLGQDILPIDATGRFVVGSDPGWWAALLFSVRHDTVASPAMAPAIRLETMRPDGPGGDVFSYVFPGSDLPRDLVDVVERAIDAPESGLHFPGAGTTPPSTARIAALDFILPLYGLPGVQMLLLPRPTFYFTLTRATVLAGPPVVPATWWGGERPSSATVLETTWDGSSWSLPRPSPSFTHRDLQLAQTDEIDALSVDRDGCKLLFSTVIPTGSIPTISQLRFANRCVSGLAVFVGDFLGSGGRPMTAAIGLPRTTDITAMCDVDPITPGPNSAHHFAIGTIPPSPASFFARTLDAQAYRGSNPTAPTEPTVECTVTGWAPGGPSFGYLVLTLADLSTGLGDYVLFVSPPRCTTAPDVGDPARFRFALPQVMPYYAPVPLQWFALSLPSLSIGSSHPTILFL